MVERVLGKESYSAVSQPDQDEVVASASAPPPGHYRGYLCVLGGFLIHLALGALYTWAIITAPVTSYIRKTEPTTTYNDTMLIFSFTLTVQSGMMVIGGLLSDYLGAKKCCSLGSLFLILSMVLASICHTVTQFVVFHGIPFGMGIGLCYTPPIATSVQWLPNHKGIVTGSIMCGLGVGAVAFGLVSSSILNPNHENVNESGPDENYFSPDSTVVKRVPSMYRYFACIFLVLLPMGCILMESPSRKTSEQPAIELVQVVSSNPLQEVNDDRPNTSTEMEMGQSRHALLVEENADHEVSEDVKVPQDSESTPELKQKPDSLSIKDLYRLPITWHLLACFICTTGGGMYLLGSFKTFAQETIHDEKFLTLMGSFSTLASSAGRIIWGVISDRVGTTKTLLIAMFIFVVIIYTYPSSLSLGKGGFAMWSLSVFFLESANYAIYFPIVVALFGATNAASNYGFIVTMYSMFFMALSYSISSGNYGFQEVCNIIGSITLLGFLLLGWLHTKVI